jgi:hypothetical protein
MKKKIYIILCLFISFQLLANNDLELKRIEDYKNYCLENLNKVDKIERVKLYENLCYYYYLKEYDKIKQKYYIDEAIKYSYSINDNFCISYSLIINILWDFNIDIKQNINKTLIALELGKESHNHEAVLNSLLCLAFFNGRIYNLPEAIKYLNLSEKYIEKFKLEKFEYLLIKTFLNNYYIIDYSITRNSINEFNNYYYKNKNKINIIKKNFYYCNLDFIINGINQSNSTNYNLKSDSNNYNYFEYYTKRKTNIRLMQNIKNNNESKIEVQKFFKDNLSKKNKNEILDFFNNSIKFEYLLKQKKYNEFLKLFTQKRKETKILDYEFSFKNRWYQELYNNSSINKEYLNNIKLNIEINYKNKINSSLKNVKFSKVYQEHYLYYIEKENRIKWYYYFVITLIISITLIILNKKIKFKLRNNNQLKLK